MWRDLTKEWIVSKIIRNQHKIDTTPTPRAVRPLAEVRAGRDLRSVHLGLALHRQPRLPHPSPGPARPQVLPGAPGEALFLGCNSGAPVGAVASLYL